MLLKFLPVYWSGCNAMLQGTKYVRLFRWDD